MLFEIGIWNDRIFLVFEFEYIAWLWAICSKVWIHQLWNVWFCIVEQHLHRSKCSTWPWKSIIIFPFFKKVTFHDWIILRIVFEHWPGHVIDFMHVRKKSLIQQRYIGLYLNLSFQSKCRIFYNLKNPFYKKLDI